jgi:hypothetical protein
LTILNVGYSFIQVYVSWSNNIRATNPFEEEEIGINPQLADLLGIKEGINISCSVIQSASTVKSVNITLSDEDYQVAECSLERIQNDMLDQISIVGRYQPFIIWLNKSISVNAVVGKFLVPFLLFFFFASCPFHSHSFIL